MSAVILFQPPNQVGLGHMSRLAAIAQAIQTIDPEVYTPFAVAGDSHSLLEAYHLPYLSVPATLDIPSEDQWAAWPLADRQMTATSICYSMLRGLHAQLVVFDCFPNWAMVRAAVHSGLKMVLVVREMRDMHSYMKTIGEAVPYLHSVLVAHDKGTVEIAPELDTMAIYVGEIARSMPQRGANEEPNKHYQLVISGGGGGTQDALQLYNVAIDAVTHLYRSGVIGKCLLITGPLFQRWHELRVSDATVVVPFDSSILQWFKRADLVISFAGYNTMAELNAIRTRVVCVASHAPYDDQQRRAFEVSSRNRNVRVFSGSDSHKLADVIKEALTKPLHSVPKPTAAAGGIRAAEYLRSLVVLDR